MVEFRELGHQVRLGWQVFLEKRVCLVCLEKLGRQENLVIILNLFNLTFHTKLS